MSGDDAEPLLVIFGASYAAHWGAPQIPGYSVRNMGVGGDATSDMLARFDRDVGSAGPAAVLIWGHINSIHRAQNGDYASAVERAKADLREMVDRAQRSGISVILATEITLPEAMSLSDRAVALIGRLLGRQSYSDRVNGHVRTVNDWLQTFARDRNVPVLDFETALDDGRGFREREFTRDDGSHVTEAGYRVLTDYTVEALGDGLTVSPLL